MIWTELYLNTPVPMVPKIYNTNFASFKRYIDIFFDGSLGTLTVPIETSGKIKGATAEFVTTVTDNLIVKNQYTNLYDNITTADYQYYNTVYIEPAIEPRDSSITATPPEQIGVKYIDVNQPYYKIPNDMTIGLVNDNLSQIVRIIFDPSIANTNPYNILLDELTDTHYVVDGLSGTDTYVELILNAWDSSWGPTWGLYKFGVADPSFGEGAAYTLQAATNSNLGGVIIGDTMTVTGLGIIDISNNYVKEASLGNEFSWTTDGSLTLSHNYVDGSLAERDVSIAINETNIFNLDSSVSVLDTLTIEHTENIDTLDISVNYLYNNIGATKIYVDGSLATRDIRLDNQDTSINGLDILTQDQTSNNTNQDTSINILDVLNQEHTLINTNQDTSISNLDIVIQEHTLININQDVSITDLTPVYKMINVNYMLPIPSANYKNYVIKNIGITDISINTNSGYQIDNEDFKALSTMNTIRLVDYDASNYYII